VTSCLSPASQYVRTHVDSVWFCHIPVLLHVTGSVLDEGAPFGNSKLRSIRVPRNQTKGCCEVKRLRIHSETWCSLPFGEVEWRLLPPPYRAGVVERKAKRGRSHGRLVPQEGMELDTAVSGSAGKRTAEER
jgi:hypothetical protein